MNRVTIVVALAALSLLGAIATNTACADEIGDAYKSFRENFDARRFSDALTPAQQVVQLSEKKYGPQQMELVIPLTNLGSVQLRLDAYSEAETSFRRALQIVEAREGGFSVEVIRPLLGLGATYTAAGQHAEATEELRRALDVSRKINGLFNPEQIDILEPLIKSYVALDLERDAERERDYAIHIAEVTFGKDDLRMLPPLTRGARSYEEGERYFSARRLYERSLGIIALSHGEKTKVKDVQDLRMIAPLRGIARTYRMEYLYGGKLWNDDEKSDAPLVTVANTRSTVDGPQLTDDGRRALELALQIAKTVPEATAAQRGEVLLDLGDWYWTTGSDKKAFEYYQDAWKELSPPTGPGTSALETPVQVYYPPLTGAMHKPPGKPEDFDKTFAEVQFTVTAEGKVKDPQVTGGDATDRRKDSVLKAIKTARYRPKFLNGAPVETPNVKFRQDLYFKKKEKDKDK
jgi:tetratricopeptide (TPR) repeat protein